MFELVGVRDYEARGSASNSDARLRDRVGFAARPVDSLKAQQMSDACLELCVCPGRHDQRYCASSYGFCRAQTIPRYA
jgi:hypothetical protein